MKIDVNDPNNWIPKDIFESYCGDKSDKLLSFYDKAVEKRKMYTLSLNWGALLLLPAWLGYRRQWTTLAIITVLIAVLPFFEALFSISISNSSVLGVQIAIGLLANGFLLITAQSEFSKLKQNGTDNYTIKSVLEGKASPSMKYAILSLVAYFVILFGMALIADVLIGLPY